jgi:hypothetical protein
MKFEFSSGDASPFVHHTHDMDVGGHYFLHLCSAASVKLMSYGDT